ncbi:MAG TPA: flagellar biosynthetic protein FliQ [Acetobacteraceae bacterium]|jgi:flagellar biosynthesis protein FliQ|nr:flagellar biosynthetic protein FliQ [Acetobacteraceae bacterium]
MNEGDVIEIMRSGFYTVLKVCGPSVLAALVTGICISVLQALTQVHEMTLANVPKILVSLVVTMMVLPFALAAMRAYMDQIVQIIVGI